MKTFILILTGLFIILATGTAKSKLIDTTEKKLKVLVITGGKKIQEDDFFAIFDSYKSISYSKAVQPDANNILTTDSIKYFDAIIFYDVVQEISENQKKAFMNLTKAGTGMVFVHHSLVSYHNWPEYHKIVGGHYFHEPYSVDGVDYPKSDFSHDEVINVFIADTAHPVTKGLESFTIHDEVYMDYYIYPHVNPVIKTDHPKSKKIIGWTHIYNSSRIVYLLLGHDKHAYENPAYRKLLKNAIKWTTNE